MHKDNAKNNKLVKGNKNENPSVTEASTISSFQVITCKLSSKRLEGAARYAGLLLAPAGKKRSVLAQILVIFGDQ